MSRDYGVINLSKREALLRLLSDLGWHEHHELSRVGGVRYGARLLELKRLGYTIESREAAHPDEQGKAYRLMSPLPGVPKKKLVRVYLREDDACGLVSTGLPNLRVLDAVEAALESFVANRDKL